MCESDQPGTRSLCCGCIYFYDLITRRFEGVATKYQEGADSLRNRRIAAVLMIVFCTNQIMLTMFDKVYLV